MQRFILLYCLLIPSLFSLAQADWYYQRLSESEINLEIENILSPTKVLYIAAHPDDENTRLISYLENVVHAQVAYLSLTNGMGGQNLIGEEIGTELGLIREQELYAARRIDGGEQFFTTAQDFGYSKTHEETFEFWGKENILEQIVHQIRLFQPDIIITRFSPETNGLRRTHGHHTASAILAQEAFEAAADPLRFTEQLGLLKVWETKAIFWNTSWWSYGGQEILDSIVAAQPEKYVSLNVEALVSERGMSSSEIAAASRSMHKSQGFGTMSRYGQTMEYLELLDGDMKASGMLSPYYRMLSSYAHTHLEQAKRQANKSELFLQGLEQGKKDGKFSPQQINQLEELYLKSLGIRAFVLASDPVVGYGDNELSVEIVHYGDSSIRLNDVYLGHSFQNIQADIEPGKKYSYRYNAYIKDDYATPFAQLTINGINLNLPVVYRSSDPVKGEIIQPVFVVNQAILELERNVILAVNGAKPKIKIKLSPVREVKHVKITFSDGSVALDKNLYLKAHQTVEFELDLPALDRTKINVYCDGIYEQQSTKRISYDHIPWVYSSAEPWIDIKRIDAECEAKKVAYVAGAGDKVPQAISALGAELVYIDYHETNLAELVQYDAIVFGIRALNVHEDIDAYMQQFYDYAEAGGTLIMQYNTAHRLKTKKIGFEEDEILLSRGRVTQEDAEVRLLMDHKALKSPNKLKSEDWENWVQERGLYFPSSWPKEYKAVLSMNDSEEEPLDGSLLIRQCGDGYFVYTGISFFRHLPAGVEGSYKLFANLLSL